MSSLPPIPPERFLPLLAAQSQEHAMLFITPDAKIGWFSAGAEFIFGYKAAEIVGEPCAKLFIPEDVEMGIPDHEREIALRDDEAEDDRYQQRADGSRFWASGILTAIRDADRRLIGFVKVLRNRTDLKEQLETLRNRGAEVEAAAHRKDVFLATLSHELRNPLAPLANAVHIIRFSAAANDDLAYALKVIERQMAVLQRLVDDMLDLSRVGAGKIELQRRVVSLNEILRSAVESTRSAVAAQRHTLDLLLPDGDVFVEGDPDRLHQVFVNLINNAVKYTPAGGRIWVKGTAEPGEAVARVEDSGVGIPHEMLPRIFDLFTQTESTRGMSQGGLGIGLALVKNLVSLHGGSVQAKSDGPGKGSEFTVRLPLKSS